jgi:hypothetical protein
MLYPTPAYVTIPSTDFLAVVTNVSAFFPCHIILFPYPLYEMCLPLDGP